MDRTFYFGEYCLSENTEIKLKNNENLLLKENVQPRGSVWNSLFRIEGPQQIIQEENISMGINEDVLSQNSEPKDWHQDSMASSQFVITQVPKKQINTVISEVIHEQDGSELTNIVESIYEILEDTNRTLNEDDLRNFSISDVDEIMERLSQQLSFNGIYNLCNSLCCMKIDIAMQYVKAVLSKILLQKIIGLEKPQQTTKMIPIVVDKMAEKFPDDIHKWIFIPMMNAELKDTTVASTIIKRYMGHRRIVLINDFLTTVRELKMWHTDILPSMVDISIDDNMKDRLLSLLVERAMILSKDKNYSKFILSFIKLNSPFTEVQKRMLNEIVAVNDTIYKTAMKQILHDM